MITASICLTDIPKEKITKSEKNGKSYLNILISDKKETDQFGNNISISIGKTKDERESGVDTIWIGSGKRWDDKPKSEPTYNNNSQIREINNNDEDDLPF